MMSARHVFVTTVLSLVCLGGTARSQQPKSEPPKKITVDGVVYDGNGEKLSGVKVQAFDVKGQVASKEVVTEDGDDKTKGSYRLVLDTIDLPGKQTAIGFILYRHDAWHAQVVEVLSGKEPKSTINKVLPLAQGPTDYLEILHQIQTYEFLFNFVSTAEIPTLNLDGLVAEFRGRVQSMPNPMIRRTDKTYLNAMKGMNDRQKVMIQTKLSELYRMYKIEDPPASVPQEMIICQPCISRCLLKRHR